MIEVDCFVLVGTIAGAPVPVQPDVDVFANEWAANIHAAARNAGECYQGVRYAVEPAKLVIGHE